MAFDLDSGLHLLHFHRPRVVLVDLGLPDGSGLDLIAAAHCADWTCDTMVISVFGDEKSVLSALRAGAKGYILKNEEPHEIGQSVHALLQGGSPISPKVARYLLKSLERPDLYEPLFDAEATLSRREIEVVEMIAQGQRRKDIAQTLGISVGTVGTHIHNIYTKLGVNSNISAIRQASRSGII